MRRNIIKYKRRRKEEERGWIRGYGTGGGVRRSSVVGRIYLNCVLFIWMCMFFYFCSLFLYWEEHLRRDRNSREGGSERSERSERSE